MTRNEIVQAVAALIQIASKGRFDVDFQGAQQLTAIVTRANAAAKAVQDNDIQEDENGPE